MPGWRSCRSERWRSGTGCTAVRCGGLAAAAPPPRKARVFAAPKLDPAKPLIDAMLREELTAHEAAAPPAAGCRPGWSMSTRRRGVVRQRFVTTSPAGGGRSRPRPAARLEQALCADPRRRAGRGRLRRRWLTLAGDKTPASFVHLPPVVQRSGAVHRVSPAKGRRHSSRTPGRRSGVLAGSRPCNPLRQPQERGHPGAVRGGRTESDRWTLFRSRGRMRCLLLPCPGIEGAHEKGGVAGEVGAVPAQPPRPAARRRDLGRAQRPPRAGRREDLARRIENRTRTVGSDLALERPCSGPARGAASTPGCA